MNQSVLSSNPACTTNMAYNKLIQLRTIGSNPSNPIPPVTTLVGRLTGRNIKFTDTQTYEEYKMRRKVEVLQYNNPSHIHGSVETKKQRFSRIVKGGSQLSQAKLKNLSGNRCDYNQFLLPPTNSGVRDYSFPGYKLNNSIPYHHSL